jgi:hypothetical protein
MPRGSAPGERRGGRAKGVPNKLTGDLRAMILGALEDAGGRDYLKRQAFENPTAFMALLGKVLPMQMTGAEGGAIVYEFVWGDATPALQLQPEPETVDPIDDDSAEINVVFAASC